MGRFELPAPRPPDEYSNLAELHPEACVGVSVGCKYTDWYGFWLTWPEYFFKLNTEKMSDLSIIVKLSRFIGTSDLQR